MNAQKIIALLGRRDEPTDAVEEYCRHLGDALRAHGIEMELARVSWSERGWTAALREMRCKAHAWRGAWVLLQYTALAWSGHGFPLRVRRVINELCDMGAHVGIVYHDVEPYAGGRMIDKVRRRAQSYIMRHALMSTELSVFTVPPEKLSWMPPRDRKVIFVPVGANLPSPAQNVSKDSDAVDGALTVAVFGVTGGHAGKDEEARIVEALRFAANKIGKLRLTVFGRNSESIEISLRLALHDVPVGIRVLGVLSGEEIVSILHSSTVLLFVRGHISSRRGSAIAGIACGLPIVAYAGPETAFPVTDAGVVLVGRENTAELGEALVRILADQNYRASLAARSRFAQERYFAWQVIAAQIAKALPNRSEG
jgi:glycosyltransferase involved in cell wall biosynthesis